MPHPQKVGLHREVAVLTHICGVKPTVDHPKVGLHR